VAFAGGHGWAVQASQERGYELWVPQWAFRGQDWDVSYQGGDLPESQAQPADLAHATEALLRVLRQVEAFAVAASLAVWHDWFKKAEELLARQDVVLPYHPDMLPAEGYSLQARQLLAAAAQAWVFGGMGSWNDLSLSGPFQAEYDTLTPVLFQSVTHAIRDAANSLL
jgi:hypothetical protein